MNWRHGTIALVILAQPADGWARKQSEGETALRVAADRIEADYVDAKRGAVVAARVRAAADELRSRPLAGDALALRTTELLRTVSGDQHFRMGYSNELIVDDASPRPTAADAAAAALRARSTNFGILRAERLPGNIGLIDFDSFAAPDQMRAPLAAAMTLLRNCDAMILDLRFSGGGHARGGALIASYFLPETPAVTIVRLSGRDPALKLEIQSEPVLDADRFLGRPLIILVGPETFSAAEMLAGALQESGRARVLGTRTRGGGNPVNRVRLSPHYALLLPVTRSTTAAGRSWEGVGITPDLAVNEASALAAAQRELLTFLVARRPSDPLVDNWRQALKRLDTSSSAPTDGGNVQ